MRTAMQPQDLNVKTYNSFCGQCKSKIKPWGGWQDHSTLKPSFERNMNWLRFVVYLPMRPAWRMGQPLNHMLHMLCTDIQSSILAV